MNRDIITLRRGPNTEQQYKLLESPNRFVVHFKTSLPGGSAAKASLRLPLMFGRRVHARKLPLPPKLAVFEVRPDEATHHLPGHGDDADSLRDVAMSYVRSTIGRERFRAQGTHDMLPLFDYADPILHRRLEYQTVPDDGLFPLQWYLRNDGSEGGAVGADIAVTEARDYTRGDPSRLIAVIDDGFELDHPEIGSGDRIVAPLNVMAGTSDPRPVAGADEWHGTSVLGLICADRANMPRNSKEKYESGEHMWIGDRGFVLGRSDAEQALHTRSRQPDTIDRGDKRETFRYGELVVLSGDFYATPDELYWETPTCIPWLWENNDLSDIRDAFPKGLEAIAEQRRGRIEYADQNILYLWNVKACRELALGNIAHFGWHNLKAYCHHHREALKFAREARRLLDMDPTKAEEQWGLALFTNAFADLFLTDAFAAGHVRVPRYEIRCWAKEQDYSDELAGALAKFLHDQDGHLNTWHGEGHSLLNHGTEGLQVCNTRGDT